MMHSKVDIKLVVERLHSMVDNFETSMQWALDNGCYATVRLTFNETSTDKAAYVLVVGFEEPEDDDIDEDD